MSSPSTSSVLPGATIGVLGSGQLGRMFTIAARRLGYRVHVLSPEDDTPTGQVADEEITCAYDDLDRVADFAAAVDVVTFEFENVPQETVAVVNQSVEVRPAGQVLHTTQHRLREKTFLRDHGFAVTPFQAIYSVDDFKTTPDDLFPGILKTAAWGYDGKGQAAVADMAAATTTWSANFNQDAVLEQRVDFIMELSVVAVRGSNGEVACYDPIENLHANHILDVSISPARVTPKVASQAKEMAAAVMCQLDAVGVLCVEYFLTSDGRLLINELAPRPHNSGHLTIDAHVSCQFEQQVRTVCGLPLGSTEQLRPAAMANLLGDRWQSNEPDWAAALSLPDVKLHLYGKKEARIGRKMGHLSATGETVDAALHNVTQARDLLSS